MKVNDPNGNLLNQAGLGGANGLDRTRGVEGTGQGTPSKADRKGQTPSDQVQLSNLSQELSAANVDSPERLAKIDQLRADVKAGRYKPDSAAVSQSVIGDALAGNA